jgi:hypothetical protein
MKNEQEIVINDPTPPGDRILSGITGLSFLTGVFFCLYTIAYSSWPEPLMKKEILLLIFLAVGFSALSFVFLYGAFGIRRYKLNADTITRQVTDFVVFHSENIFQVKELSEVKVTKRKLKRTTIYLTVLHFQDGKEEEEEVSWAHNEEHMLQLKATLCDFWNLPNS